MHTQSRVLARLNQSFLTVERCLSVAPMRHALATLRAAIRIDSSHEKRVVRCDTVEAHSDVIGSSHRMTNVE